MCSVTKNVMLISEIQRSSASLSMEFTAPCKGNGKMSTWGEVEEKMSCIDIFVSDCLLVEVLLHVFVS